MVDTVFGEKYRFRQFLISITLYGSLRVQDSGFTETFPLHSVSAPIHSSSMLSCLF